MLKNCLQAIAGFLLVVFCVNTLLAGCLDGCDVFLDKSNINFVNEDHSDCGGKNINDNHHDDGIAHNTGHCCSGYCPMMPSEEFAISKTILEQKRYSYNSEIFSFILLQSLERPPKSYSIA